MNVDEVMKKHRVSRDLGFLLKTSRVDLPHSFQPFITICDNLPVLVEKDLLRENIDALSLIHTHDITYEQSRVAHLICSSLVSAYLWHKGPNKVSSTIPAALAQTFLEVSEKCGIPPVVVHGSVCCANWRLIDENLPFVAENLKTRFFRILDTDEEEWFFTVTAEIEKNFGATVYRIVEFLLLPSEKQNNDTIQCVLETITESLRKGEETIKKLPNRLSPNFFYNRLRTYLWGYNMGSLAENGVLFQGSKVGWVKHMGASAAQSSILPLVDAFLNVKHNDKDRRFLESQLSYMPPEHRAFIEWVGSTTTMSDETQGRDITLTALKQFRSEHIKIVSLYIICQKKGTTTTGTGGTSFMNFLKTLRNESA